MFCNVSNAMAQPLPDAAGRVLYVLEKSGAEAWVVGGWVRDAARGSAAHDVDIATSARWQDGAAALEAAGIAVHETGTAHGTITAVVCDVSVEVTTYRVEGPYDDHRHPRSVCFVSSIVDDLARRDFTINAMAYHPARGLLDPFGGLADLKAGIIRAVGDPTARFDEDALRLLRAVRFACRLGFVIEPATQAALDAAASSLALIASERIGAEIDGIVASGRLAWAMDCERRALCSALPELAALYGFDQRSAYHAYDVAEHTRRVCIACEAFSAGEASHALRWAALLHDIAKPATFSLDVDGRGHFFGHPEIGSRMAQSIMRRLALPATLVREACALVRWHDLPLRATSHSIRRLLALLDKSCPGRAAPLAFALLDLKRADAVSKVAQASRYAVELDEVARCLRRELAMPVALRVSDLAISGADVMQATGMAPGPAVGLALDVLLVAVLHGDIPNTREALLGAL